MALHYIMASGKGGFCMLQSHEAIQFLSLAQDDAYVCHTLLKDPDASSRIIGFHAQQAVEKAFKAILIGETIAPARTHDLTELAYTIEDNGITLPISVSKLAFLSPYAVTLRYGGEVDGALTPEEACDLMDVILQFTKDWLDRKSNSSPI